MLFSLNNRKTIPNDLNIKIGDTIVERVREIKFLRVQENLFWKMHMIDLVRS